MSLALKNSEICANFVIQNATDVAYLNHSILLLKISLVKNSSKWDFKYC